VSKYRDPTLNIVTSGKAIARHRRAAVDLELSYCAAPPNGMLEAVVAASMPATDANWSSIACRNLVRSSQPGYCARDDHSCRDQPRRLDAMSIRYIVRKLRSMRPLPASSTSVSAIWATMSPAVQCRVRMPPDPVRPPFLQHLVTLCLGGMKGRSEAEDDAGREAQDQ